MHNPNTPHGFNITNLHFHGLHVSPAGNADNVLMAVGWKDTIFMPAGTKFELRTRYERYIGTFVHPCHVLDHEDFGMMETLEIIPPRNAHEHPPH